MQLSLGKALLEITHCLTLLFQTRHSTTISKLEHSKQQLLGIYMRIFLICNVGMKQRSQIITICKNLSTPLNPLTLILYPNSIAILDKWVMDMYIKLTWPSVTQISPLPILKNFLDCRPFECFFVFYPSFVEPFLEPFEYLSINFIREYFYHGPQPRGKNLIFANALSSPDKVLYKVVVGFMLPIVTKGLTKMRLSHLFMMTYLSIVQSQTLH